MEVSVKRESTVLLFLFEVHNVGKSKKMSIL